MRGERQAARLAVIPAQAGIQCCSKLGGKRPREPELRGVGFGEYAAWQGE
jgi:hypothetical protein